MTSPASLARLHVATPLAVGAVHACTPEQVNYLLNVLRMKPGDPLLVFDGWNGEWLAELRPSGRKACDLVVRERRREQAGGPAIRYLFAPLKHARLDYMVQKATELGAASLQPVITRRTQVARLNEERMRANVVEAAEQCGVLRLPDVLPAVRLERLVAGWDAGVPLIFCDEAAPIAAPVEALARIAPGASVALLIGPEGGFDPAERELLLGLPFVHAISLGPRIMRADTAAVAALALVGAVLFAGR